MKRLRMTDGIIVLDSKRGDRFGFTSERYGHGSYLWKKGNAVVVSFIVSRAQGNLRKLFKAIWGHGLAIHVPTPFKQMEQILKHYGFTQHWEDDEQMGAVEVWKKAPEKKSVSHR